MAIAIVQVRALALVYDQGALTTRLRRIIVMVPVLAFAVVSDLLVDAIGETTAVVQKRVVTFVHH